MTHSSRRTKNLAIISSYLATSFISAAIKNTEVNKISFTCCRKAISWLVPHLSGFGRLRSFRYSTSLSQSFGLYTRPVLELITMHDCCNF